MLGDFTRAQRDQVAVTEKKVEVNRNFNKLLVHQY